MSFVGNVSYIDDGDFHIMMLRR